MAYCCSQCSFTTQFESSLAMHHQLHHESSGSPELSRARIISSKSSTVPRHSIHQPETSKKGLKLPGRTPSATKLFDKLRTRICRSKAMLSSHAEEKPEMIRVQNLTSTSECPKKGLSLDVLNTSTEKGQHTYSCHLCTFDADRITVLDRHLLNDHKIGLDNLLKLVLDKTKNGLSDDNTNQNIFGIRQPYYSLPELVQEGEFIVQTVQPKIKILKHSSTNTDAVFPNLNDNCKLIKEELEKFMSEPIDKTDKVDVMSKMQTLSDYMGRFVDSSNALKRVLNMELDAKSSVMKRADNMFELGLGDQDSPRHPLRAHSEKMEQHNRNDSVQSSRNFYF